MIVRAICVISCLLMKVLNAYEMFGRHLMQVPSVAKTLSLRKCLSYVIDGCIVWGAVCVKIHFSRSMFSARVAKIDRVKVTDIY